MYETIRYFFNENYTKCHCFLPRHKYDKALIIIRGKRGIRMGKKRYSPDFKMEIVKQYRLGTAVNKLSSEYGISEVTIYKWIKLYSPVEDGIEMTKAEILAVQKENVRLKQEVDILKKAITIFAPN